MNILIKIRAQLDVVNDDDDKMERKINQPFHYITYEVNNKNHNNTNNIICYPVKSSRPVQLIPLHRQQST